jgi:hypothetical protein
MRMESWQRVRKEEHEGERVKVEWAKRFLWSLGTKQIKKWRDVATHFISRPEWKIPEAAAAEILEDYIILWMDRWHVCENSVEKRMKGHNRGIAARGAKRACSFSISLGSAPLATSRTQTQQMQYNIENK